MIKNKVNVSKLETFKKNVQMADRFHSQQSPAPSFAANDVYLWLQSNHSLDKVSESQQVDPSTSNPDKCSDHRKLICAHDPVLPNAAQYSSTCVLEFMPKCSGVDFYHLLISHVINHWKQMSFFVCIWSPLFHMAVMKWRILKLHSQLWLSTLAANLR